MGKDVIGHPSFLVKKKIWDIKEELEYQRGLSTGWNTLCLCPNCNAEYKYGAVSLFDFVEKVKLEVIDENSDDYYVFDIEMQCGHRKIKYTPKHLLALQTALKYFENMQEKKQ